MKQFILIASLFFAVNLNIQSQPRSPGKVKCARWLKTFISGVPIHFIENKPNFQTL